MNVLTRRRQMLGAQSGSDPYIIKIGTITPDVDTSSISIPFSGAIDLVFTEGHVPNHQSYMDSEHDKILIGWHKGNADAFINSSANPGAVLFQIELQNQGTTTREEYVEFWSSGTSITLNNGVVIVTTNRQYVFRAGIPIRYIVVGRQ